MRNALNIAWRDIRSVFVSPIAYVVIVIFLATVGLTFRAAVEAWIQIPDFAVEQANLSLRTYVMTNLTTFFLLSMLFYLPALSMRLMSEERKNGTAELLLTSPITTWQLVLGKYFGTLFILALILVLTLPQMLFLEYKAAPEWGAIGTMYLAYLLFGAVVIAVGLFASSLTENQIVALLLTIAIAVLLFVLDLIVPFVPPPWDSVVGGFSIGLGVKSFTLGLFNTHFVVLPLALIGLFLFLCAQVLDSNRWR